MNPATPVPAAALDQSTVDLKRRIDSLRVEIHGWEVRAKADQSHLGLYSRRLVALNVMFDALIEKRLDVPYSRLIELDRDVGYSIEFRAVQQALGGVQDAWRVFRAGFLLLSEEPFRPVLDAANLITAECFNHSLKRANDRLDAKQQPALDLPAPPLVHLMTIEFPQAASCDVKVKHLGVRILTEQRTPLPVVILPEDYIHCAWLLPFLYHEVGHLIDEELKVAESVAGAIEELKSTHAQAWRWRAWSKEVTADVFGVLYGGPGYALALAKLLHTVGPALLEDDKYPPHWLRVPLVAELLDYHGKSIPAGPARMAWVAEVKRVRDLARPAPTDPRVGLLDELAKVAAACLAAPVPVAASPSLSELGPSAAEDWEQVLLLSDFLATARQRPNPRDVPCRLVPAAAALAVARSPGPKLNVIHDEAIAFADQTWRPTFLGESPDLDHLRKRTDMMNVNFT